MYTIKVALYKWSILLLVTMGLSVPQYPILYRPMLPPPPPPPPPQPIQVPVPVAVPLSIPIPIPVLIEMPINSTTATTTTTTAKPKMNYTFFIPISMPLPFPMGIVAPPPVIMIPFPPATIYRLNPSSASCENSKSSKSSSSDSDCSDSDSESSSKEKKSKKKKRYGIYRRYYRRANHDSTEEELKPVLNFVSKNGDIKLRRDLSKHDAAILMQNELSPQQVHRVHIMVGDDSKEKSRVKVVASNLPNEKRQIVMRRSAQQIVNSNKELVFKPPSNKKISNISISFNVAR